MTLQHFDTHSKTDVDCSRNAEHTLANTTSQSLPPEKLAIVNVERQDVKNKDGNGDM